MDITTIDPDRSPDIMNPRPAVNPPMLQVGDAMSLNPQNTLYVEVIDGKPTVVPK